MGNGLLSLISLFVGRDGLIYSGFDDFQVFFAAARYSQPQARSKPFLVHGFFLSFFYSACQCRRWI